MFEVYEIAKIWFKGQIMNPRPVCEDGSAIKNIEKNKKSFLTPCLGVFSYFFRLGAGPAPQSAPLKSVQWEQSSSTHSIYSFSQNPSFLRPFSLGG